MTRTSWLPAVVIVLFLSACSHALPKPKAKNVGPPEQQPASESSLTGPPASDPRNREGTEEMLFVGPPAPYPIVAQGTSPFIGPPAPAPTDEPGKTAYLTFDDGPSANTERILAVLKQQQVPATFFVVGHTSEAGKQLYRKIAEEGHVIGNHTFTHNYDKVYTSVSAFRRDVEKLNAVLEETTGKRSCLLRFPGGSNNKQSKKYGGPAIMPNVAADMLREGYAYFDWNVSSTDAAATVQPKQDIIDAVKEGSRNKNKIIVLMHDVSVKTTTVEALPDVIRGLREQGFHFDVLRKDSFTFRFLNP